MHHFPMSGNTHDDAPAYYQDYREVNGHGLHAIEGQIHDLVWQCFICGARRVSADDFAELECE